ncbi:IS110 family transposase [Trujillonella endophytica]|uniref:Transposase IS116/IS110/IS902 family protein n=1 Tax=Trujillonella endophytica TaxID=673521 RepID=A0A1H8TXU0_9ACTN|nr:IS110 family transposase [Trujillella endophytica]SEO95842.1 Transposase IS116/IS110/IS902 family protein [Trujillella endophytica]
MLFVGDDWAEDHHDIEVQDEGGRRLARARLAEGIGGLARLHELIAEHLTDDDVDAETGFVAQSVVIGIETDRGTWVSALVAAGYQVFALNPVQVARYRERHGASGAKSDRGDAHVLAEIVRLDRAHHRPMAGDSPEVEGLKLVARSHQAFIWDRTRHFQRLRSALREYFPAALEAFPDLMVPEALELLERAPDPARAARLSRSKITAALIRAHRRDPEPRAEAIQAVLRAPALRQDPAIEAAYAVIVASAVRLIASLNNQIAELQAVVAEGFGRHPDAEIVTSQPGLGPVLGARVLAEFGDDHGRYAGAKARKNYAGTSPITRASGTRRVVLARYARNRHLADAAHQWAFCALTASPGARAYYDTLRARGTEHHAALRQLGNRLVGILHGCLKTRTTYREDTAWPHLNADAA